MKYRVTLPDFGAKDFTTTVTRNYLDNPLTALAKSVERDVIEDEMRQQAASQIMRQLGRVKAEYEQNHLAPEATSSRFNNHHSSNTNS